MRPYAIAKIEYVPRSEAVDYDFSVREYTKAKRRCDRSKIISEQYSPFPTMIPCHERKHAVLEFDTKKKFDDFQQWLQDANIPLQCASYRYPQKEARTGTDDKV